MTLSPRLRVYETALDGGLVPLFYSPDADASVAILRAVHEGGGRILEFTNRGPGAIAVFARLVAARNDLGLPVRLGAGSIADRATAAHVIALGADFVVSASLDPAIARTCNRLRVAYVPGAATPTEIAAAEELGAEIVKVFPAEAIDGPAFIRAVLGPSPSSLLMPTGGVAPTPESVGGWISAGAACLGMGSSLIRSTHTRGEDLAGLPGAVAGALDLIRAARAAAAGP